MNKRLPNAGRARNPQNAGTMVRPQGGGLGTPPYGMGLPWAHPKRQAPGRHAFRMSAQQQWEAR